MLHYLSIFSAALPTIEFKCNLLGFLKQSTLLHFLRPLLFWCTTGEPMGHFFPSCWFFIISMMFLEFFNYPRTEKFKILTLICTKNVLSSLEISKNMFYLFICYLTNQLVFTQFDVGNVLNMKNLQFFKRLFFYSNFFLEARVIIR